LGCSNTQSKKSLSIAPTMPRSRKGFPSSSSPPLGGSASRSATVAIAVAHDGQIGVLKEQGRSLDVGAVGNAQQAIPEVAFQIRLRIVFEVVPESLDLSDGSVIGDAVATKLTLNDDVGRDLVIQSNDALQPAEQTARLTHLRPELPELVEPAVTDQVDAELRAVRRDAHEPLAGVPLALGKVAAELRLGVASFAGEIALDLEYGATEQGVDAPAHLWQGPLEINAGGVRAEPLGQQAVEQCPDLVVTRLGHEFGDDQLHVLCFHDAFRSSRLLKNWARGRAFGAI
jgi:hypothetical protein